MSLFRFFLCLVFIACTESAYKSSDTLVIAIDSAPKTLDPRFATDAYGQRINGLLFQSLVRISDNFSIEPEAASSWTYKNLKYNFIVPKIWFFSNGKPVTKEDILFSFSEYQKPSCPFSAAFKDIKSVKISETESDYLVEIRLHQFRASFLTDLVTIKILPKDLVLKHGNDFSFYVSGSGPYFLEREDINLYVMKKNPYYPNNPAKTDKIHFKVIQDESTRYLKMKKGELDIAPAVISPLRIKDFDGDARFLVNIQSGLSMNYLLINLNHSFLKEKVNRQAIAQAINAPEIINYKLEGYATQATSILSPNNLYFNSDLKPIKFDLAEAQSLIKTNNNPSLVIKTSNSLEAIENAKIIANQLKELKLEIQIQSYEWGTFYNDVQTGNYDLALMRWVGATDPDIYRIALHSKEIPPGRNRGHYKNSKLDELLDQGLSTEDITTRKSIYNKAQEIVHKDLPIIPLWYNQLITVQHQRVKNYKPRANGDFLGLLDTYKETLP